LGRCLQQIYQCGAITITVLEPSSCSGTDVIVQNQEFDGAMICEATSSLETNLVVMVRSGAVVAFLSPKTVLNSGFSVESGAVFAIDNSPRT